MIEHQISAVTEVYHRNFDTTVSVQVIFLCDLSFMKFSLVQQVGILQITYSDIFKHESFAVPMSCFALIN